MKTSTTLSTLHFLPLLVLAMLVNILAQAVHETGHHLVYQAMGHEPVWAFTKVVQMSETTPSHPDEWTQKPVSVRLSFPAQIELNPPPAAERRNRWLCFAVSPLL